MSESQALRWAEEWGSEHHDQEVRLLWSRDEDAGRHRWSVSVTGGPMNVWGDRLVDALVALRKRVERR